VNPFSPFFSPPRPKKDQGVFGHVTFLTVFMVSRNGNLRLLLFYPLRLFFSLFPPAGFPLSAHFQRVCGALFCSFGGVFWGAYASDVCSL